MDCFSSLTGIRTDKEPYRAKSALSLLEPRDLILNFDFECQYFLEVFFRNEPYGVPSHNDGRVPARAPAGSYSETARRFDVCVENSVPVASGAMARSGLGKGLGALIGTPAVATPKDGSDAGERVHQIELTSIVPSTLQPRKDFARDVLLELIESIRQHGIIQPLIVRQVGTRFELIAGERRWRAAQELGLATVPAIVRTANDLEVLELSLIENLQRADLNPIEEAQGYARLANEFGMRQEDIALKVGRSRAAVANALRLLDLHPQVQIWLAQNLVSVGHAKVLLALKAPEEQLLAAETVLRRNATVRSTERMVARLLGIGRGRRKPRRAAGDSSATATAVEDLQNRLQQHLATHVTIHHGEKRGRIEIEYLRNRRSSADYYCSWPAGRRVTRVMNCRGVRRGGRQSKWIKAFQKTDPAGAERDGRGANDRASESKYAKGPATCGGLASHVISSS